MMCRNNFKSEHFVKICLKVKFVEKKYKNFFKKLICKTKMLVKETSRKTSRTNKIYGEVPKRPKGIPC